MRECARVLAPGGRLFATFFLLNDASIAALPTRDWYSFPVIRGPIRLLDADSPATGVAYDEKFLAELIRDAGLAIERVAYGQWTGRQDAPTFQDIVLCRRS